MNIRASELPENPYDTSNALSKVFCFWLTPFIKKGFKKELVLEDLYRLPEDDYSKDLGCKLKREWNKELQNVREGKRASFVRALCRAFGFWYLLSGIWVTIGEILIRPFQAISLGWLIRDVNLYLNLDPNANPDLINEFYWKVFYDGLLVILFSIISLITVHPYVFCTQHIGMKVRVACCHLIYRHSLKLSNAAIGQTTVGQMVNLLSNDVNRFDLALTYIQYLVIAPIQAIVTLSILSVLFLGFYSTAAGALVLLIYVPFQTLMGRWFGRLRQLTAKRTDERIRLMNEIIPAMRVIKMYTWEDSFAALVELARENEVRFIRYTSILRGINMALFFVASKIILFICFITYILLGYTLDAEIVFVSITLFNSVRLLMTLFFPYGVAQLAETLISCSRLQEFLLLPKQESTHRIDRGNSDSKVKPNEVEVVAMDVSANWTIINKTFATEQVAGRDGADNDKESSTKQRRHQTSASLEDVVEKTNKGSVRGKDSIFSASTNVHLSSSSTKKKEAGKKIAAPLELSGSIEQTAISALRNVTYQVRSGELMIILGRVGSGKSSVLMSVLGELPLASGQMKIRGRVSYASQEPWIFAGTVRENVLFGKEMEESRYKTVLRVCALDRDLQLLPEGDATIVGERGVSLSGGQRARINLARAVYYEADIYLLDDPLSAVDAIVAKHIFNECISGFLKEKAVILATHQTQFVSQDTKVLFLQDGRQISCKSYSDNKELQLFMGSNWEKSDSESALSSAKHSRRSKGESGLRAGVIGGKSLSSTGSGRPDEIRELSAAVGEQKLQQEPLKEQLSGSSSPSPSTMDNNELQAMAQSSTGSDDPQDEDDYDDDDEKARERVSGSGEADNNTSPDKRRQQQTESTGGNAKNNAAIYWYYIKASKAAILVFTLALANLGTQALFNGSDFWLSFWTDTEQRKAANGGSSDYPPVTLTDTLTLKENAIVYTVLIMSLFVLTLVRTTCFFVLCMRSSVNLHKQLFRSVLKAPIKFFDYNPIGVLLNRVSRDMGIVDDQLPPTAFDTIEIAVNVLGTLITVAAIDPLNILPAILLCSAVAVIRLLYIRSVRSIKTLEGVTRSPVFSHLAASLNGLATIRAFQVESEFEEKFDQYQDVHSSAWFLFVSASRWLGCSLDWLSLIYIAVITLLMTLTIGTTTGSQIGLAISSALFLSGSFQWGVRQSTEMESQMCSVSRIREYSELPEEPPRESDDPPAASWPEYGQIEFKDVSLRYFENEEPVLKKLTFSIRAGEQVGIVGRTGAGKSSIIEVLFRLTEPECGEIIIDGRRTRELGLLELRKKLSIIPQEPILFNGPIRRNLDPFAEYNDMDLWRALEQVKLADLIRQLPGALDAELNEGGSNFSVGERQLICLARAVLRQNRIIILDEATANVDPDTDKFIQRTISESFTKCTRLTIAHRLKTIMDSDRVLVMEAGEVKEFGEPHLLLQNESGIFSQMVKNTGKSAHLRKIARNCYERRLKKKALRDPSESASSTTTTTT